VGSAIGCVGAFADLDVKFQEVVVHSIENWNADVCEDFCDLGDRMDYHHHARLTIHRREELARAVLRRRSGWRRWRRILIQKDQPFQSDRPQPFYEDFASLTVRFRLALCGVERLFQSETELAHNLPEMRSAHLGTQPVTRAGKGPADPPANAASVALPCS
jgi:hypothetical protein